MPNSQLNPLSLTLLALLPATWLVAVSNSQLHAEDGQVDLVITDDVSEKPLGARVLVQDSQGRTKRFPNSVWQGKLTYVFYQANLKLPPGPYLFQVDAGPEFEVHQGQFEAHANTSAAQSIALHRIANLPDEGWLTVLPDAHGPSESLNVMLQGLGIDRAGWVLNSEAKVSNRSSNDFHAPTQTRHQWFKSWQWESTWGGRFHVISPEQPDLNRKPSNNETPMPSPQVLNRWLTDSDQRILLADSALANELPFWLGLEQVAGVGLLPWFVGEDVANPPISGYDIDRRLRQKPRALGIENELRYYELLDCGLKLAATASSQWDDILHPMAQNRMLVYQTKDEPQNAWFAHLQESKTWVTNGPLLRIKANDQPPGTTFTPPSGAPFLLDVSLRVSTRYPLEDVELVHNGQVIQSIDLRELRKSRGKIPPVEFTESGWLVVRVRTQENQFLQMSSTSPFYVDFDQQPRISRQAVESQLERLQAFYSTADKKTDETLPSELKQQALGFWQNRLDEATHP